MYSGADYSRRKTFVTHAQSLNGNTHYLTFPLQFEYDIMCTMFKRDFSGQNSFIQWYIIIGNAV